MNQYLLVVLSTALIYIFLIAAIVLFGKRELAQLTIIDLVFILLISNAVQNAMVNGDLKSLWLGLLAAGTLFALNYFFKNLLYRNAFLNKLVEGKPVMLIYEGEVLKENLEQERITMNELEAAVREHGIAEVKKVGLAVLETDGNISVISYEGEKKSKYKPKETRRGKM